MAVYTDISDEELRQFVAQYDLGAVLSCHGIVEGVENSNFHLVTERGPWILTLYERRVAAGDLPFFLGLMAHLARRGVVCPQPVAGRDGHALRSLGGRPAAIVTFLTGMSPRRLERWHCTAVGALLARMHLAGGDFPLMRPNQLSLAGWAPLFEECRARAHEVRQGLAGEIAQELAFLTTAWPVRLPRGVIHADLFPDNVFFERDRLTGVFDFYFACTDYFAYDLAVCLNAWCFESDGTLNVTKAGALMEGYTAVRPLEPEERQALPVLARGSALRFLLTRLYDWLNRRPGAVVRPKDPLEYWRRLSFHRHVASAGDYGLLAA